MHIASNFILSVLKAKDGLKKGIDSKARSDGHANAQQCVIQAYTLLGRKGWGEILLSRHDNYFSCCGIVDDSST